MDKGNINKKAIEDRFTERDRASDFGLVPGHYPNFKTVEEVDKWFDEWEEMSREIFDYAFRDSWICKVCNNEEKGEGANYCKICGTKIES